MPAPPKTKFETLTVKKVVADVTKRFYVTNLNKIASAGFSTVKGLLDNQADVLKIVKDQPADRQKGMMNAIFYAVSDHPNTQKVTYYNYFQVLKGKDPKYVEHKKKEEEKKAAAPPPAPAPAEKPKRKYTKTEKFYAQKRLNPDTKRMNALEKALNVKKAKLAKEAAKELKAILKANQERYDKDKD